MIEAVIEPLRHLGPCRATGAFLDSRLPANRLADVTLAADAAMSERLVLMSDLHMRAGVAAARCGPGFVDEFDGDEAFLTWLRSDEGRRCTCGRVFGRQDSGLRQ